MIWQEKAERGEDKANDGSVQQYTCTYVVPPAGVKLWNIISTVFIVFS